MVKIIDVYNDVPLVVNKTYKTKFQTGWEFIITRIITVKSKVNDIVEERVVGLEGIYPHARHLGVCPLNPDRIIHEKEYAGTKVVCPHCNKQINEQ